MQLPQKTNRGRKSLLIAAVIISICSISYIAYRGLVKKVINTDSQASHSINYDPPTNEQKNSGEQIKINSVNPDDPSKPNPTGSDRVNIPTPKAGEKATVNAVMTSTNQDNQMLKLRFNIGTITSTGVCTLTLKKDAAIVTMVADVQALAGSSTCKGFDIPVVDLSPGKWSVSMNFENDSFVSQTSGMVVVQ